MNDSFEKVLLSDDKDKLNELKRWLFEENIRLEIKQKELSDEIIWLNLLHIYGYKEHSFLLSL